MKKGLASEISQFDRQFNHHLATLDADFIGGDNTIDKHQAVILYYKGEILTLWLFLSKLFQQYDEQILCSCDTLSKTPHLAYLLLLRVECNLLIHDLSSEMDKQLNAIWRFSNDFFTLTQIIQTLSIDPELKTKAMAMRVMMTVYPGSGKVSEIWADNRSETSQIALRTKVIEEAKKAISIHKQYSTDNGDILRFTLAYVKDAFGASEFEAAGTALASRVLDRSELYFSIQKLASLVEEAVATNSSEHLRLSIRYAEEAKVLGEWGGMFTAGWWLSQRLELADSELWKKATEGGVWSEKKRVVSTAERNISMTFMY